MQLCVDASFTELSFANLRELIAVRAVEEHRPISMELARAVLAIRRPSCAAAAFGREPDDEGCACIPTHFRWRRRAQHRRGADDANADTKRLSARASTQR